MSDSFVDGVLVQWGDQLFNSSPVKVGKPKKVAIDLPARKQGRAGKGGGGITQARAAEIRSKLGAVSKRTPEVMVKITNSARPGAPKPAGGMRAIAAHLDYISRNGKLAVEDQDGSTLRGKSDLASLRDEWQYGGFPIAEDGERREAFNIALSMPAGTDPHGLLRAARAFAGREFADHQYVMVLHTPDIDPHKPPAKNPHVHLCVKAVSLEGHRLNPRKADLQRWREGFAQALQEHGIEAAATPRQARFVRERSASRAVHQMKKRGVMPEHVGATAPAHVVEKAEKTEKRALKAYKEITTALASSDKPEDRQLAGSIVQYLGSLPRVRQQQQTHNRPSARTDHDVDR